MVERVKDPQESAVFIREEIVNSYLSDSAHI